MLSSKGISALLLSATFLLIVGFSFLKPIPQDQSYHHFADQRSWLGIPYTWNVLSNLAISLPGVWGLFLLLTPQKVHFNDERERWFWIVISIGFILTGIGSGYYHLDPNNSRLVWDRLPMTLVFMSLVAALIGERINLRLGLWLWPLLVGIGFYSVWSWHLGELQGHGDLRLYKGLQTLAILVTAIMVLSRSPYDRNEDLIVVVLCYALALLCDKLDHQISHFLGDIVSGHTFKHLLAGLAGAWLIRMIYKRKKKVTV